MKEKILGTVLKGIARLPLGCLYIFSDLAALILQYLIKYRTGIVRQNLRTAFPEKNEKEIKIIEKEYYRYLGDQIVETLKLFHISDKELRKRVKVIDYDNVNTSLEEGKNVVLFMGHYNNWEWVQEISRYFIPSAFMASIYHPLSNKVWDNLFKKIRSRWGAHIVQMRQAPRTLLDKKNMPWVCGFIADAWNWHQTDDNWIDFLNHKTWFITGPEEIGKKVGAEYFYLQMTRIKRGYYEIKFIPLKPSGKDANYPYTREFWRKFENTIESHPAYWLWSHNRWK